MAWQNFPLFPRLPSLTQSLAPSLPHFCPLQLIMLTAQVPCHGCSRLFVLRGLSQHVSKSSDPCCQSALRTSRAQVASLFIQHTAMSPPLNQNGMFAHIMWCI